MFVLLIPLAIGALYLAFRGGGAPALALASGAAITGLSALLAKAAQALAPIPTNTASGVINWRAGQPPTAAAVLPTLKWTLVLSEGGISLYEGGAVGDSLPTGEALATLPALVSGSAGPALVLVGTSPVRAEALGSGRWVVLDRPLVRPIIRVSPDQMPPRPQAAAPAAQPPSGLSQAIGAKNAPLVLERPTVAQGAGKGIVAAAQAAAKAALDMASGGKGKPPPKPASSSVNTDAAGRLDSVTDPSAPKEAQGSSLSQAAAAAKAAAAKLGSLIGGHSGELLPEDEEARTSQEEGNDHA